MADQAVANPNSASRSASGPQGSAPRKMTLGARLIQAGIINEAQLDLALRQHRRSGKLLGEVLMELGFVTSDVITRLMATDAKAQVVDISSAVIDEDVINLVSYDTAKRYNLIPLSIENNVLTTALSDAFNVVAIDHLERETGFAIDVVTAPAEAITDAVERHYARGRSIEDTIDLIMTDGTLPSEDDAAQESPLVRLVDQIIALGIKRGATDIHIEPDEKIIRVRMRLDGVMRQQILIPKPIQSALTARVKLLAGLNITEKRIPQDGRIRFLFGQSEVDLRVSTLPINTGESLVLRILDRSGINLELPLLGFSGDDTKRIQRNLDKPYGMILVTGPTGSGKTTTLYAGLGLINSADRSVFTLEDPIEYSLRGIRQTQVKPEVGMDFASGLRALLRQDPDVILIGEIRDLETAQLAARAALTGHLVLSTLHTNDAVGVIPRLIDMGVDRYMLPASLQSIVAQRLVRKICDDCKTPAEVPAEAIESLGMTALVPDNPQFFKGAGCDKCNNSGYRGRQVIYEILNISERMHAPIIEGAPSAEIRRIAREMGMLSMLHDGFKKACAGVTTVEEVLRVVR
ncbi:MAG: ATPase, T2SS/T4P/T4SS family [Pseudomonadota bacterium]